GTFAGGLGIDDTDASDTLVTEASVRGLMIRFVCALVVAEAAWLVPLTTSANTAKATVVDLDTFIPFPLFVIYFSMSDM
uniref:hypothetical protein n=1 Tax=Ferrimicrobium acidiphilum TaxID=121039 RepID=UPI0023F0D18D